MSIKKLNPYLNFNGTAAKAIKLYETALGAKVENVMPWADAPGAAAQPRDQGSCHARRRCASARAW